MAISVDEPAEAAGMLERQKEAGPALTIPVACDPSREAVKAFGVFDHAHDIALPATLILDREGKVAWKYIGETVMDRPEEDALIATLKKLSQG